MVAGQSSGEGGDLHGTDGSHGNSSNRRSTQHPQPGPRWGGTLSQARVKMWRKILKAWIMSTIPSCFSRAHFRMACWSQGPRSRPQAEFTPQALANRCRSGWFQLSSKVSPWPHHLSQQSWHQMKQTADDSGGDPCGGRFATFQIFGTGFDIGGPRPVFVWYLGIIRLGSLLNYWYSTTLLSKSPEFPRQSRKWDDCPAQLSKFQGAFSAGKQWLKPLYFRKATAHWTIILIEFVFKCFMPGLHPNLTVEFTPTGEWFQTCFMFNHTWESYGILEWWSPTRR